VPVPRAGYPPLSGDPDFADFIDEAFQAGYLTEPEWFERRKWHDLIARAA
jgi:hypothetical protein